MATITLPRRPAMTADGAPDRGAAKGPLPLPVLLADRQEVAFVATPRGIESLRIPPRYWGAQVGVVAIPVSDEEVRGAELQPSSDAGAWPRVVTRPDLLAPALSRLLAGEHTELSLQPGRNGLKATLLTPADEEQPFPVAPKDALGFLAAVFQHAPRGVVKTAGGRARRVLLSVRPAARPHEYRVRIIGVVEAPPPATLADIGQRGGRRRSEEHTSELQSPYDLVCRLPREKQKKGTSSLRRIPRVGSFTSKHTQPSKRATIIPSPGRMPRTKSSQLSLRDEDFSLLFRIKVR